MIRRETLNDGASYLQVLCADCPDRLGQKQLYYEHNGYTDRGEPVTELQKRQAKNAANKHSRNHDIRIIEGKL